MKQIELINYYLELENKNIERHEKDTIYNKKQYKLYEYAKDPLAENKRLSWLRSESRLLDAKKKEKKD